MSVPGYTAHRAAIAAGRYLRVVNYHNTPASGRDPLRAELAAYTARFSPLGLADVDAVFETGCWPGDRSGFFPVFYEGYRNSYDVAAGVCEELGITGWFAVCTGFVDCPVAEQELFARSHWIGVVPEEQDGRRLAMSWDELARLSRRHVVFPHTASHAGTADVVTGADLRREVHEPKQRMDALTGQQATVHAWLGGTPYGASAAHDRALLDAGYRYVLSNTMLQCIARRDHAEDGPPSLIRPR